MNSPYFWFTIWNVSLHQGLQLYWHFLSPLEINEVCNVLQYPNEWFSICVLQFLPHLYYWRLWNLNHPLHYNMFSFIIFSPNSMHQTLFSGLRCIYAMRFHHSIILWIARCTGNQPHCQEMPVIKWMESRFICHLRYAFHSRFHSNLPTHTVWSLVPMVLIKKLKTLWTEWE